MLIEAKNVKKTTTIRITKPLDDATWKTEGSLTYNNIRLNELFTKNIDYHSGWVMDNMGGQEIFLDLHRVDCILLQPNISKQYTTGRLLIKSFGWNLPFDGIDKRWLEWLSYTVPGIIVGRNNGKSTSEAIFHMEEPISVLQRSIRTHISSILGWIV